MPAKLTQEDFIRKAKDKHGELYSYKKVKFLGIDQPVEVLCNRCHTYFTQNARSHYQGRGCAKCNASGGGSVKMTTAEFIAKARGVHGARFSYRDTVYAGAHAKVTITCKKHGAFEQSATSHLAGTGCPTCSAGKLKALGASKRVSTEEWVKRFIACHGTKYDYSKTVAGKDQYQRVKILCPVHGEFLQSAVSHAKGSDCPRCACSLKYVASSDMWLRGYEPQALEYIVKAKLAKRKEVSDVVPKISYDYAGKQRRYTPDFFIATQNRIVEVKSIGTMGLKGSFASPKAAGYKLLAKLKALRKGSIAQGFKFSLLLMHDTKRILLPQNWYELSIRELRDFVNSQLHTRL